jgi:hypothetical protein
MDCHAERVLIGLDELATGLHHFSDDQVRLDGVLQHREQGELRAISQQPRSQPSQICGTQGRQRPATALPTLHASHVHPELLSQLDLG